jgi:hypothetical protein
LNDGRAAICELVDAASRTAARRRSGFGRPEYSDEWHSFVTVLDAHASEEERDLCPPPTDLSEDMLEAVGNRMIERIAGLRR